MPVNPIPRGFHAVTPYLIVDDPMALIDFTKAAFGAEVVEEPFRRPDGKVVHAEVKIGDSIVMLGEAMGGEHRAIPAMLYVYVPDADATHERAVRAGATSVQAPTDMFYGDRSGAVKDGNGNIWWIATHVEDVSREELTRRAKAQAAKGTQ